MQVLDTNTASAPMREALRGIESFRQLDRPERVLPEPVLEIAAHALAVGGMLVTANVDQMTRVPGLAVEGWSWWTP